jgi:surface protein
MFYGCSSLKELNISSFDTSSVNNMKSMFFGCKKLTSLDLLNFDTRNVINIASMFSECRNLAYINFYNFKEDNIENMKDIFFGTPDNLIICIKNEENTQNLISQLSSLKCAINDCSIDWKLRKQKIIFDKRICTDNCLSIENYKYEFKYFCYDKCPLGTHSSKDNKYICEEDPHKCIENFLFVNLEENVCVEDCTSKDFFIGKCTFNLYNSQSQKTIINNIKEGIKIGQLNSLLDDVLIDKKEDIIKQEKDILYQITTLYNQNNKNYENISLIKLGECENIIKKQYHLSKEETLIIFKIEKIVKGLRIPLIEYEIFSSKSKK